MNLHKLAEKLIEAKTKSERENILKTIPETDLVKLAVAVKEICYSFWTSEPTKAQASAKTLENIYKFSPQKEIKAYSEWINGIAEITRGNLVPATERLDGSAAAFLHLGNELEAAQTQVSKLYVLALLGHYDEAVECGKNTLKIFKKYKDDLSTGRILHNLGNLFFRREIYRQAEKYQLLAHKHFLKANDVKQVAMIEHSLAVTYSALNNFCEAERFYSKALLKAQKVGMIVTQAEIESSLGYLALFRGRLKEALKFLELSRQKYETLKMPHQTTIAELEIADVYLELNLTTEAISIYKKVADGYEPPWIGYLAIEEDTCVGFCGFKSPPQNNRVEIAYFTFPEYESRGVATRMAAELIRMALDKTPAVTVAAQTLPEENASTSVLKKLRFRLVDSVEHPEDGLVWEWHLRDASEA
jgi:tetratricopeptide (TPR) repeat protein